jgi:hypothetical protein
VVLSRLRLNWATDSDIAPFLAQPKFIEDFLSDKLDFISSIKTDEAKHALIWCISNLVPIHQFGSDKLNIVFYENLVVQPESEIDRVFRLLRLDYDPREVMSRILEPATTTLWESAYLSPIKRIGSWKDQLTQKQIDDVMSVVHEFGLDNLYDQDLMAKSGT